MVFQHFSLFEAMTVARTSRWRCRAPSMSDLLEAHHGGLSRIRPAARSARIVADLSVGERQRIEIVRCLLQEPKLLIMDEPTSVLTPQEADELFVTLAAGLEGCSILYISHKLEEVRALCHTRHDPAPRQGGGHLRPAEETSRSRWPS
jgi:general nucleoside transport system ATP-binding protein